MCFLLAALCKWKKDNYPFNVFFFNFAMISDLEKTNIVVVTYLLCISLLFVFSCY